MDAAALAKWNRLALLFIYLTLVFYVEREGRNLAFSDSIYISGQIVFPFLDGELSFRDLFGQHSEHRIFFSNLSTVILSQTGDWNTKWELRISYLLAGGQLLILAALLPANAKSALIPCAFLLFSLRQKENWLWGFQTQWFFVGIWFLLGLLILHRLRIGWRALFGAALMALAAQFSLSSGFLAWGIYPLVMGFLGYGHKRYFAAWGFLAFLSLVFWFSVTPYQLPTSSTYSGDGLAQILAIFRFMLTYLGGVFVPYEASFAPLAIGLSLLGMVWIAQNSFTFWQKEGRMAALWLGMSLFALGAAYLTAYGRASTLQNTPDAPMISRYTTTATFFWLGGIGLAAQVWAQNRAFNRLMLLVLCPLYLFSNLHAVFVQPPLISDAMADCAANYPQTRDDTCLGGFTYRGHQLPDLYLANYDELARRRLNLFSKAEDLAFGPPILREKAGDRVFYFVDSPLWSPMEGLVLRETWSGQMIICPADFERLYLRAIVQNAPLKARYRVGEAEAQELSLPPGPQIQQYQIDLGELPAQMTPFTLTLAAEGEARIAAIRLLAKTETGACGDS